MLHIEWQHHTAYGYMWQLAASGFVWEYPLLLHYPIKADGKR